jgi:hypothetical protein
MKPKKVKVVKIKDILSKKQLTKTLAEQPVSKLKKTLLKHGSGFVKIRPKRTKIKSKTKHMSFNKKTINKIYDSICQKKQIVQLNKDKLINVFQKIIRTNNIFLINKFIKDINRRQLILLLYTVNIVKMNTKAPTPLLKNILYNYLTSSIKIVV